MRTFLWSCLFVIFLCNLSFADEVLVAHCQNPKGKAYFPYKGLMLKERDSGWQNDEIRNAVVELVRDKEGGLDIRYVDASRRIKSSRADGGQISILNKGEKEFAVSVYYPGSGIEVYTFFSDRDGKNNFILTQVRGGDGVLITKSSILVGSCDSIAFNY